MIRPVRIQLRRQKGFRLQEHSKALNGLPAVNVARPSKWGSPFKPGEEYLVTRYTEADVATCWEKVIRVTAPNAEAVKQLYGLALMSHEMRERYRLPSPEEIVCHLRGKNLACWCPLDQPCHADVLLEMANDWPDKAIAIAQRGGRK